MLDTTRTYFYGVATDEPNAAYEKKPEQPQFAVNDLVYYFAPGKTHGDPATVTGYYRDDDGRIKVKLIVTRTGEEITTTQRHIRY